MKKIISILIVVVIGLVMLFSFSLQTKGPPKNEEDFGNITVSELKQRLNNHEDLILLDVRTPQEFTGPLGHIEGAVLIPVQELESRFSELDSLKDREIIVICRSGNRSRIAAKILTSHGFKATNLLGGMKAWNANKVEQVHNKKGLSTEDQVQEYPENKNKEGVKP